MLIFTPFRVDGLRTCCQSPIGGAAVEEMSKSRYVEKKNSLWSICGHMGAERGRLLNLMGRDQSTASEDEWCRRPPPLLRDLLWPRKCPSLLFSKPSVLPIQNVGCCPQRIFFSHYPSDEGKLLSLDRRSWPVAVTVKLNNQRDNVEKPALWRGGGRAQRFLI